MDFEKTADVVILGSGPAGCTAAVYASRAGLNPVLISGPDEGGQLVTTPEIGNWPGAFDDPSGFDLMQNLQNHAKKLGTEFISDMVTGVDFKDEVKSLKLFSGKEIRTRSVIIATGAKARYLGLDSETKYKGRGVSACATCDGFFFRNKAVAVVGGGSAAFVEALYLCKLCSKVYLIHRRDAFRSEQVLVDRFKAEVESGKAEFVLNSQVVEVVGDEAKITGLRVKDKAGQERTLEVSGMFVAVGHEPATAFLKDALELTDDGYIKIGFGTETQTSVPGVFAAGDCSDRIYRQAIVSAGQGCKAALDAERYLGALKA